jgi:hypothetical protein
LALVQAVFKIRAVVVRLNPMVPDISRRLLVCALGLGLF